jgi:hypothetical protein
MADKKDKYLIISIADLKEIQSSLTDLKHKKAMDDVITFFAQYTTKTGLLLEINEEFYKKLFKRKYKQ